jgi:hypothetical protein
MGKKEVKWSGSRRESCCTWQKKSPKKLRIAAVMAFVWTWFLSVIDKYMEFTHCKKKISILAWNPFIAKPPSSSKRWEEDDELLCKQCSGKEFLENLGSRKTCTKPIDQ